MTKVIDRIVVDGEQIELVEQVDDANMEPLMLAPMNHVLDMKAMFKQLMFYYESGINQVTAKLQIMNKEFALCNDRNPIDHIKSRIKSMESIMSKMRKLGLDLTFENLVHNIKDAEVVKPGICK